MGPHKLRNTQKRTHICSIYRNKCAHTHPLTNRHCRRADFTARQQMLPHMCQCAEMSDIKILWPSGDSEGRILSLFHYDCEIVIVVVYLTWVWRHMCVFVCFLVHTITSLKVWGGGVMMAGGRGRRGGRGIRWVQGSDGSARPCRGLSRQRADGPLTLAQGESIKSSRQDEKTRESKNTSSSSSLTLCWSWP